MRELLVVVDYQNDFVTGSLGNPAAVTLEQGIAERVQKHLANGGYVIFTRDTHEENYLETREGKFLPVPHCIRGTEGWHLFGALAAYEKNDTQRTAFVDKPTFGSTELPKAAQELCGGAPDKIEICGVVTDICVVSNAIMLHSSFLDAEIAVLKDLCAAVTEQGHERALALLAGMGYEIV